MKSPVDINKKVQEALESLDGIQKAEPQPYFFTRLKARLERDQKNVWELAGSYMARPAVAIAGLMVILAINVFILIQKETTATNPGYASENNLQLQEDENIFAAANNTYEYENLEP